MGEYHCNRFEPVEVDEGAQVLLEQVRSLCSRITLLVAHIWDFSFFFLTDVGHQPVQAPEH